MKAARLPVLDWFESLLRILAGVLVGALVILALVVSLAILNPVQAGTRSFVVPPVATLYRLQIERIAARNFGLDPPIARLAAQIHQESGWNWRAQSAYASGLAQFTPATAAWIATVCADVGEPDVWDPLWSLRAQGCYMHWLHERIVVYRNGGAMSECTRWNFALRGYNGGLGLLNRERIATRAAGEDANDWRAAEHHRARATWAHTENINYPRRILLRNEPVYVNAGWPGVLVC